MSNTSLTLATLATLAASQASAADPAQVWLRFLDQSGSEYQPSILRSLKPGERVRFNLVAEEGQLPKARVSSTIEGEPSQLEITAFGGLGNQSVSRNIRDQYGNPLLTNSALRALNFGYDARVPVRIGPVLIRGTADGNHFLVDGNPLRKGAIVGRRSTLDQSVDRQSIGLGLKLGPFTPIALADSAVILANKNDGMLNAQARVHGYRSGGALRMEYGIVKGEAGYLQGDMVVSVNGDLFGIPVKVPESKAKSRRAYGEVKLNLGGYEAGIFGVNEGLTGDASTDMTTFGVTGSTKPLSTKGGDFRLGLRLGANRINNGDYSPRGKGFSAGLSASYALRLRNLRRY